jgi:hypothetical protein
MTTITQAFVIDGKIFASKAEAQNYIRIPKITEALNIVTGDNTELTAFLIAHQEEISNIFSKDSVRRVTNKERADLVKALEVIESGFLKDHADAIVASFKWPTVAKVSEEVRQAKIDSALTALFAGDAELVKWMRENSTEVLDAYAAGVEKREVSEKAAEGLAAYQARVKEQLTIYATQEGRLEDLTAIYDNVAEKGVQAADAAKALGLADFWKAANVAAKNAAKVTKEA